jgi:glycerol-3-phosphate dehydrogenase (NAD(P)+)
VKPIAILGAGAWGTALALHASRIGLRPTLWVYEPELARLMTEGRENPWYLPGIPLGDGIRITHHLAEAVADQTVILAVVPSHAYRSVVSEAARSLSPNATLVNAAKGLEGGTLSRMTVILEELVSPSARVATLSGPTFAREVALGLPTAAVVASRADEVARAVQALLASPSFRLYTSPDVVGVELGGALKNIMAIAAGLSDGLGLGDNARAALITRGLAEMTRLGVALGARSETFAGLSGLGDLVLTAAGSLSRNRRVGLEMAGGRTLKELLREPAVAEGIRTAGVALELAKRVGVEMPITTQVEAVLHRGVAPREAMESLLRRSMRAEVEEPAFRLERGGVSA